MSCNCSAIVPVVGSFALFDCNVKLISVVDITFKLSLASILLHILLLFHMNISVLRVEAPLNLEVEPKVALPPATFKASTTALTPIPNLLHLTDFHYSCLKVIVVLYH